MHRILKEPPFGTATFFAVAALALAGCASVAPAAPARQTFASKYLSIDVERATGDPTPPPALVLTLTNTSNVAIAVLRFDNDGAPPARLVEAEPVRGRYFFHKGRPGVAPVDDDVGGAFYRTNVFLLPGQSHTFECPLPAGARGARTFFIRYLLLAPDGLAKSLFLPAQVKGKAAYLAASPEDVSRSARENAPFPDALCATAGAIDGFRFQISAP